MTVQTRVTVKDKWEELSPVVLLSLLTKGGDQHRLDTYFFKASGQRRLISAFTPASKMVTTMLREQFVIIT